VKANAAEVSERESQLIEREPAAFLATALQKAADDEHSRFRHLAQIERGWQRQHGLRVSLSIEPSSTAGVSRRTLLLGTAAAAATAITASSARANNNAPRFFLSTGPVQALRSIQSKLADSVSVKDYGAVGDGNSHRLSSINTFNQEQTAGWTLRQWQAVFPFATELTNEVDGLAIQAAANTGKAITVPAGTYLCSMSISTDGPANAIILGAGKAITEIRSVTPGADGWRHGLSTAATGVFHAAGVSFTTTSTGGGSALNLNFSNTSSVLIPYFTLDTVFFIGAENCSTSFWTHAVLCNNVPRGLTWHDVTAYGNCNSLSSSTAFQFNCTTGSFGYQFINVLGSNYNIVFEFNYGTTAPGIEGVELFNCQSYNGNGLVSAQNTIPGYLPPQWSFINCGWQGDGTAFALKGIQDVLIENAIVETNALSYAGKPLLDLSGCMDVWISRTHCGVNPSATHVVFSHCDGTCFNVNYDLNAIVNFGSMDHVYNWDSNLVPNVIREFRTAFRGTGTLTTTITNDTGGNQISEAWINAYIISDVHATVNFAGTYHLGAFGSGTTDSNGQLKVTFPTRPGTGLPLFLQTPHVVVTPENNSGSTVPTVTIVARTRTYFTIKWTGWGAGHAVKLNYLAYGE
jgi:hypothetical protein